MALAALLAVAVLVFVTRAQAADILGDADEGRIGWWILLRPATLITAGAAVAGTLLLVVLRVLRRSLPRWRLVVAAGVAVAAAALLITTPTEVTYSDGCNDHGDLAPAVAVPYLKAAHPEKTRLSYFGSQTLMACGSRFGA